MIESIQNINFEAVYIGSRHDTTPLKILPIKSWIYIDSLPNMKAGFEEDDYSKKSYYLDDVVEEFKKGEFEIQQHNKKERMMIFKNHTKVVVYFYNVIFPKCSVLQLKLLKNVTSIYLCAFDPDRKILNMIHQTKPITIYIFYVALYYRWDEKKQYRIDFEKDRMLTSYLLFQYIENIKYIWLKNEGREHVEKVKVSNLLEYHYLEQKQNKHSLKIKEMPIL
jgi:hypothetical protein